MNIHKHWEIICDGCGGAEHASDCSKKEALRQFRDLGMIFKRGLMFCTKECEVRHSNSHLPGTPDRNETKEGK